MYMCTLCYVYVQVDVMLVHDRYDIAGWETFHRHWSMNVHFLFSA